MADSIVPGLEFVLNIILGETPSRFFILGKTNVPLPPHLDDSAKKRGCIFIKWSYGERGTVFLLTNHADVAQSEEMIVLNLGFTRSPSFEHLSARHLLEQGLVSPQHVDHEAICGNVLVTCISQKQPSFCMYQNLTTTSQIHYWEERETILFSDTLRMLVPLVSSLELNQEAVPRHFLFRCVPGKMTYFKGVHKILCGQIAKFRENELQIEQLNRLDDWMPQKGISKVSPDVMDNFDMGAERIIGSYVHRIKDSGHDLLVLLSGGIDSSLLTSYIQANLPPQDTLLSSSYTIEAKEFDAEIGYAQHASDLFNTNHEFLPVLAKDYISLMEHLVDLVAQPFANEQDPCYVALAKHFSESGPRYLFSGSVADTLFGYGCSKRLLQVERYGKIPLSGYGLDFLSKILKNIVPNKAFGLKETAYIVRWLKEPSSPHHPNNREGIFTNLKRVQRSFGTETISKAIGYRLAEFDIYSNSQSIPERTHLIGLTQGVHNDESFLTQVFRSYDLEIVIPYLDSKFVRSTLAFDPKIRYFAMGQKKWLPKALIEKRVPNGHQITQKPKRAGGFDIELRKWMKSGLLKDLVHAIDRPDYMTRADFEQAIEKPDWFTWNLLTLDLFQKRLLNA